MGVKLRPNKLFIIFASTDGALLRDRMQILFMAIRTFFLVNVISKPSG